MKSLLRSEWLWAAVLLLAGIAACLWTGFEGLYGQDAYEYERYTDALRGWMQTGQHPGDYFWPVLYPLLGAVLSFLTQQSDVALQGISLLSHVLSFVLVAQMLRRHAPGAWETKLAFAFLSVGLAPILVRHAPLVMADSLSMLGLTAGVAFALRYREAGRWAHALLAAVALAGAFMTRYVAAVPAVVPAALVVLTVVRRRHWALPLLLAAVSALVLLPHFVLRAGHSMEFTGHAWLMGWNPLNAFRREFSTPDGHLRFALPNLVQVCFALVHPGFMVVGLPLLGFIRRRHLEQPVWRVLALTVLVYLLFLAAIPYQNIRFLSLTSPCVAALLWWPFHQLWEAIGQRVWVKRLAWPAWMAAQWVLIWISLGAMRAQVPLERDVAETLKGLPPGRLYTFSWEGVVRHHRIDMELKSIFEEQFSACEDGYLLIQPQAAETQWQALNPGLNWEFFSTHCGLEELKRWDKGWVLYRMRH